MVSGSSKLLANQITPNPDTVKIDPISYIFSVMWLAGDVKEPTHLSQRVGCEVPGVVVRPCLMGLGASYRVNGIAPLPLELCKKKIGKVRPK